MKDQDQWLARRKRLFYIVEVGASEDRVSRLYDLVNSLAIVINLIASILYTFEEVREPYGPALLTIEAVTVAFFSVDYCLRLWTARFLFPKQSGARAVLSYIGSFSGLVDLLSFLPYYLPVFLPSGAVAFRMFRVVRIFRLFLVVGVHPAHCGLRGHLPHYHHGQIFRYLHRLSGGGHGGHPHRHYLCRLRGPVLPHQAAE